MMRRFAMIMIPTALMLAGCGGKKSSSTAGPVPTALEQNRASNLFELPATGEVSDKTSFIGLWESRPAIIRSNSSRISRLLFTNSSLTVTVECRYNDGEVVYATADADARLEANGSFTILEKRTVESTPAKEPDCTADINRGTIPVATVVNGQIAGQTPPPENQPFVYVKIAD